MNKKILLGVMLLTTGFLVNTPLMAAQSESPVACNEGAEPGNLVYGDHTTGCEINPSTDLDSFQFDGTAGDVIRISLHTGGGLDGRIELIEPVTFNTIADVFCDAFTTGCSLNSRPITNRKRGLRHTDL